MAHKKWKRSIEQAELALLKLFDDAVENHKDEPQFRVRGYWVRSWLEYNILYMLENLEQYCTNKNKESVWFTWNRRFVGPHAPDWAVMGIDHKDVEPDQRPIPMTLGEMEDV
jgi:hypothetical protein